ncbi:MAG: SurA N-terminal domain-containing protein [Caulobacteraceae bacterium]|nr:SurA N-terminal domain-containing protein [Caulobacteraceae bacterium]
MISFFRKISQSIFAKFLFGLLIIAMGAFGAQQAVKSQLRSGVIEAGDRVTTENDFKRIFDNRRKMLEQQMQRPVTQEELVNANEHRRIAEALAGENSFLAWLDSIEFRPGDQLITDAMSRQQAFLNPVTGAFDKNQFLTALRNAGVTEAEYQRETRDQLATTHFGSGMATGLRAPSIFGALQAAYTLERRNVTVFQVTPQMAGLPARPTDAQLTAFINTNKAQLRRPEFRQLTLVMFTASAVANQVSVPEAEIRRDYDARKDSLAQAERRTFVAIPVRTPQAAQKVISALRAGQDPNAVARSVGVSAVAFNDKPQTSVPDVAVARAAFSLQAGQVSDPIRGQLGMSVVKVTAISPGHAVSFEEARPEILRRLTNDAAAEKVYEAVQKFEDAREAGKPLLEAARISGGRVVTLPAPVTEQGIVPSGQRLGNDNMKAVFEAGFALPPGGESDTTEDFGNGEYFAVKVDRVIPAGLPTLANNRVELTNAWMIRELDKRLKAKADELANRIRRGESVAAVVASAGGRAQTLTSLPRQPNPSLGQLVGEIFLHRAGEVFTGTTGPNPRSPVPVYLVGRVDQIQTPAQPVAARMVASQAPRVADGLSRDMAQLAQAAAKAKIKPKVKLEAVDAAVGVTAPDAPPAGKKK